MRPLKRSVVVVATKAERWDSFGEQSAAAGTVWIVADKAIIALHGCVDADPSAPRIHRGMACPAQFANRLDELVGVGRRVRIMARKAVAFNGWGVARGQACLVSYLLMAFEAEVTHFLIQKSRMFGCMRIVARRALARLQRTVHMLFLKRVLDVRMTFQTDGLLIDLNGLG
jgi:hypothetical protein